MFHANAWGLVHGALATGASLVLPDRFLQAEPLAKMIETERVTAGGGVPTIWADLLNYLDTHEVDTSSLRAVLVGGSACPPALMRAYDERHHIHVLHAYGMTETSPLVSVAVPPPGVDGEEAFRYRVTQGRLAVGVQARIVSPDGALLPWDGVTQGELELAGPWITGSYFRASAEEVAEKFDDGWLRTGDVGTVDEKGYVQITDRAKDVIKSGGEWISSVDLENELVAHPGIAEAAVVAMPDLRWQERPAAYLVARPGAEPSADELREWLARRFVKWWLPERYVFVDALPKTGVGKLDKRKLRERAAALGGQPAGGDR
jgi:fatty-acyl-CoA synthase